MQLKRLAIGLTLATLLVLMGCSDESDTISETKEITENVQIAITPEDTALEPPDLTINFGEEILHPFLGSYSWTIDNGDGKGEGIEADSESPPDLVKGKTALQVSSDTSVELNFEDPPNNYILRIWNDNYTILKQTKEVDLSETGIFIYEVLAHWEQGTASYAFVIEVIE